MAPAGRSAVPSPAPSPAREHASTSPGARHDGSMHSPRRSAPTEDAAETAQLEPARRLRAPGDHAAAFGVHHGARRDAPHDPPALRCDPVVRRQRSAAAATSTSAASRSGSPPSRCCAGSSPPSSDRTACASSRCRRPASSTRSPPDTEGAEALAESDRRPDDARPRRHPRGRRQRRRVRRIRSRPRRSPPPRSTSRAAPSAVSAACPMPQQTAFQLARPTTVTLT